MIFEELKRVPLGDAFTAIAQEGGAVTAGLLGAGMVGRQVENMLVRVPVTPTSTVTDKVVGWAANNVPKALAWYVLKGKVPADVQKGIVTSAAFDTLMRLLNEGVNPATASVMGYQVLGDGKIVMGAADTNTVQRLVQENSTLRTEVAKLKGTNVQQVAYQEGPYSPRLPPYVGSQQVIPPAERERKFAFMQPAIPGLPRPPGIAERERKYGFAGEVSAMSSAGKPGAAYVQAGKMFGMQ
jgi:hypothetical protein